MSTTQPSSPHASSRIAALDAVRGIAIGYVMLRHASATAFGAGGFVGVELFFVLSGFLITGNILRARDRGTWSYGTFYINRALRLFPPLAVALVIIAGVALATGDDGADVAGSVAVAALYLADFATAVQGLPLIEPFSHLWTLAVEEQFYLFWPILLVGLAPRISPSRVAWGGLVLGTICLMVTAAFVTMPSPAYELPTTWIIALFAGCVMATAAERVPHTPAAAWVALLALSALIFVPDAKSEQAAYVFLIPVVAALAVALIANAASTKPIWPLRNVWLQRLGLISYAAYIWNWPIQLAFGSLMSIPLTIIVATASYWLVEKPALRHKRSMAPAPDAIPA